MSILYVTGATEQNHVQLTTPGFCYVCASAALLSQLIVKLYNLSLGAASCTTRNDGMEISLTNVTLIRLQITDPKM